MPKRKRKKFRKPKNIFDRERINRENEIIRKYGLKNKREIWKAESAVERIRRQAKRLITASEEEKEVFLQKLKRMGFKIDDIAGVLGLSKEDWLNRRLQTIVFRNKIANTPKQARQFITHKLVSIGKKKIDAPSYFVKADEEKEIKLDIVLKPRIKKTIKKTADNKEEVKEDG